jgi:hypothetical protein
MYTRGLSRSFLSSRRLSSIFFLQRRKGSKISVTSPSASFLWSEILGPSCTNAGLSIISRAAAISQQLSHFLERSLSNIPYESSAPPFTITASSSLRERFSRTWLIPSTTRSIAVSRQPFSTSSCHRISTCIKAIKLETDLRFRGRTSPVDSRPPLTV